MTVTTLPGDIPGLLRRGSPVIAWTEGRGMFSTGIFGWRAGLVVEVHADEVEVWTDAGPDRLSPRSRGPQDPPCRITLDLTDVTGRVHAQWWATSHPRSKLWPLLNMPRGYVLDVLAHRADDTAWWTSDRIALLAEVVLRLAGRWP